MEAHIWLIYSKTMKEGFLKSNEYLQDQIGLLEKASLKLKHSFSIEEILSICFDKNRFKDFKYDERKDFAKNIFEIYFSYSKNILLYFDIYSEKSITENTSQIVNYLSKIPNFKEHLAQIGYQYQDDSKEWKYAESSLTNERSRILQCIAVSCCLGYSYLNQPFKFLSLSIFDKRRNSLQCIIEGQHCEYCNFELQKTNYSCSVCNQGIEDMEFFKNWQINFSSLFLKENNNNNNNVQVKNITNSLPTSTEFWQCSNCTFLNPNNYSSCNACFQNKFPIDIISEKKYHSLQENDNKNKPDRKVEIIIDPEINWECAECTTINTMEFATCTSCFSKKKEMLVDKNEMLSLEEKTPLKLFNDDQDSENYKETTTKVVNVYNSFSKTFYKCSNCAKNIESSNSLCEECLKKKSCNNGEYLEKMKQDALDRNNLRSSMENDHTVISIEEENDDVDDLHNGSTYYSLIWEKSVYALQKAKDFVVYILTYYMK